MVSLLRDRWPYHGEKVPSALLVTQIWKENTWIHTLLNGIIDMGSVSILTQGLSSGHRVKFR